MTTESTSITQSILPKENVAMVTSKPSFIRLHAHTEALEDSISKSSRDKRSSPQISESSRSSPQKCGSSPSQVISISSSPSKVVGRRSQPRFHTLPSPVRADTKIETTESKGSPKGTDQILSKESIWSISGVKIERFCKNLLKKPKKKQFKEFPPVKSSTKMESDKESPSKQTLTRTSSEPRMTGKSKFYVENVDLAEGTSPAIVSNGNEKVKKKRDKFLKKKAKSASLLQKNSNGKIETTQMPPIPIFMKSKGNQSTSSDDAFSPSIVRGNRVEVAQSSSQRLEPSAQRSTYEEDFRKSGIVAPSTSSAAKDPLQCYSRQHKIGSHSHQVKIHKLEREPKRRSRNVNSDFRFVAGDSSVKHDEQEDDDPECDFVGNVTLFSNFKNIPPSSSSSSSILKRDKIHKNSKNKDNKTDNMVSRRNADQSLNNGTGTGTVTSGESCITTSPMSGERSILSDSGYSVTSNELILTDTGYVVLDCVGTASRISPSSTVPKGPEGVKNVNAGYIHSPLHRNEIQNLHLQDVATGKIHSTGTKSREDTKGKENSDAKNEKNNFDAYSNTYPQTKSLKKVTDPFITIDQATSSLNINSSELPDTPFLENRSRNKNANLGFSREDFETIKHRTKSVEMFLSRRSKQQKPCKKRACSISRERSLITITTTTEEFRYPRMEINQKKSETIVKNVHFSQEPYVSTARPLNVHLPSMRPQHKGMQTSPDKIFMTTDFPFMNEEFKIISHDGASFVDGTQTSNILVKIPDNDNNSYCLISTDHLFGSPTKSIHVNTRKGDLKFTSSDGADDKDKIAYNLKQMSEASGNKRVSTSEYDGSLSENISSDDRIKHDKLDKINKSKKLSAVSYFDGSKWLALSSDETASDDDQKVRVPQHVIIEKGAKVKEASTKSVESSTRCVETQTSEDIGHQHSHLKLDRFSQTQFSSSVEANHDDILRHFDDGKQDETNVLSHEITKDNRYVIRRDSIKSVIAHEYGEMYSIFKEVPPTLTFLKAKVVSSDQFNASENLKEALERYPDLKTGTWSWGQKSSVGFGFILASLGSEMQHGEKIYDATDRANNQRAEFISYRFEPLMEVFTII